MILTERNIASVIDHTYLKPDITADKVKQMCAEAIENEFASVCIPPYFVKLAAQELEGRAPKVCTVIGFPMGYSSTPAKVEEARKALDEGAQELDMVVNIAAVKNKDWSYVINDLQSVTMLTQMRGSIIKIILETGLLTKEEIMQLCKICMDISVDFVKTSTGLLSEGPSVETIHTIKEFIDDSVKIKASGGVKTKEFALELMEAGISRIGTSSAINIIS